MRNAAIPATIAVILIAGLASQVQFTAFRDIELRYPQASSLAKLLDSRATGSSLPSTALVRSRPSMR